MFRLSKKFKFTSQGWIDKAFYCNCIFKLIFLNHKASILVVGGVAEMRKTHPDRITLVLKNRKGFAKMALKTGADLGEIK